MPSKFLLDEQDGTPKQLSIADHLTDFGPTAANLLEIGTPTDVQMETTSLADAAGRQSAKADLGAVRAPAYKVRAAIEFAATPTAGAVVSFYWAPSPSATAGTANPANVTGADAAYAGYSANLAASVKQLDFIGNFICTAQATPTVQVAEIGYMMPSQRYGSLVIVNSSGAAFHSDDAETHTVMDPVYTESQ